MSRQMRCLTALVKAAERVEQDWPTSVDGAISEAAGIGATYRDQAYVDAWECLRRHLGVSNNEVVRWYQAEGRTKEEVVAALMEARLITPTWPAGTTRPSEVQS